MTKREYRRIVVKNNRMNRWDARRKAVKLIKVARNAYTGVRVELTRMTAKSGAIIYGVVVRNMKTGRKYRLWTKDNIRSAWNIFKGAAYAA